MFSKSVLATLSMLLLAGCASAPPSSVEPEVRAQVMVLGVYHFRAGGTDYVQNRVDDHLSPERQREIDDVLDRLEQFRPSKIIIELEPQHEAQFNDRYFRYRSGAERLGVNERDQLGMALAARLGHDRLYGVDFPSSMDFSAMLAAAESAGQTHLLTQFHDVVSAMEEREGEEIRLSVRERLLAENTPEAVARHNDYMILAQMGSPDNPVGAREMGNWWSRNMIIYARIAQIAEPGDRVLVIYGGGHKFLLEQYFHQTEGFQLVDPLVYLR